MLHRGLAFTSEYGQRALPLDIDLALVGTKQLEKHLSCKHIGAVRDDVVPRRSIREPNFWFEQPNLTVGIDEH